jgi:chromosome partitioning protein
VDQRKAKNFRQSKSFRVLKRAIESVEEDYDYDYVIIDSPPSLSLLTVNGMIAADYLILPVQTEFYALEGVAQLLESMAMVKKAMNPQLKLLGVLATMYDKRTSLSAEVLAEVRKYFKEKVFEATIPRNVRVAEAPSHGVPVGAYDKFSKGAKAYKEFAREVEERTRG